VSVEDLGLCSAKNKESMLGKQIILLISKNGL